MQFSCFGKKYLLSTKIERPLPEARGTRGAAVPFVLHPRSVSYQLHQTLPNSFHRNTDAASAPTPTPTDPKNQTAFRADVRRRRDFFSPSASIYLFSWLTKSPSTTSSSRLPEDRKNPIPMPMCADPDADADADPDQFCSIR